MSLYFQCMKMHIKSSMQYKTSFILSIISQFFVFFTYYFTIMALFERFGNIKGFTVYEVLLSFGIIHFGFAFNETFFRGVDSFHKLIISGKYDQLLIRPRGILLQVLCSDVDVVKIARVLQSILVLIFAIVNLNLSWNAMTLTCILLMLISAVLIFFGLFLLAASYCFITVEGLEVRNVFTDGGKYMAQYPIGIYKKPVALFFTFIIPYAFVNYYPLMYVLGKESNILYAFSPLLVIIFLLPCLYIFKIGSRKYMSTGS